MQQQTEKHLIEPTEFVNNISHEIRIPLHGITALSKGLVENWNQLNNDEAYDLASKISINAERLLALTNDILNFAKVRNTGIELNNELTDLNVLILSMIQECNDLYILDKQIEIKFENTESIMSRFDAQKITQVIRNLLTNAIKFTNQGTITISLTREESVATISVSDEGVGIPQDELGSIFQSFAQSTRTKGKISGAGLGLAISQKIVDAHGGKIWAENNSTKGTKFAFTLPLFEQPMEYKPENKEAFKKIPSSNANIMVIDNEETCLRSIQILSLNTNYNIFTYKNPLDAIEFLKQNPHKVDVVLVDVMMPEMTGIEFLRIMNDNPITQHIPVAIQSGTSDEEVINMMMRTGASAFVHKPYSRENLVESIEKSLSNL